MLRGSALLLSAVIFVGTGAAFANSASAQVVNSAALEPAPVAAPAATGAYKIVLKDEFAGETIDAKWVTLAGIWREQNSALQSSLPVLLRPVQRPYAPIASAAERPLGLSPTPAAHLAAIAANGPIDNAFRVSLALNGRGVAPAALSIGPYLGDDAGSGYRLVYDGEYERPLKILSTRGGKIETIAAGPSPADFYDGERHTIVWTRDATGRMGVAVDGQGAIETTDRSIDSGFSGFSIVNTGGSWGINAVTVEVPED